MTHLVALLLHCFPSVLSFIGRPSCYPDAAAAWWVSQLSTQRGLEIYSKDYYRFVFVCCWSCSGIFIHWYQSLTYLFTYPPPPPHGAYSFYQTSRIRRFTGRWQGKGSFFVFMQMVCFSILTGQEKGLERLFIRLLLGEFLCDWYCVVVTLD